MVLHLWHPGSPFADTARLAVTALPVRDPSLAVLYLQPVAESCRLAREFAHEALTSWGLDDAAVYNGKLVVNELVTNAVERSASDQGITIKLFLSDFGQPIVEVTDEVDAKPEVRTPAPDSVRGRGLLLVESSCESWGTNPLAGGGKVVWAVLPGSIERQARPPS
jgi:anti-sigma regulatory factor (Ser/Thr protein kinase)